jgi:hypothetical protein
MDLDQDRERWWFLLKSMMNLRGCIECKEFLIYPKKYLLLQRVYAV